MTRATYERQGDYYIPCLTLPAEEEQPIGLWGQRHLRYIREHHKALYTSLLLSGKLNSYLADIDQQAETMLSRLVEQMAQRQGVTEQLKASDQMAWVGRMNNIRATLWRSWTGKSYTSKHNASRGYSLLALW